MKAAKARKPAKVAKKPVKAAKKPAKAAKSVKAKASAKLARKPAKIIKTTVPAKAAKLAVVRKAAKPAKAPVKAAKPKARITAVPPRAAAAAVPAAKPAKPIVIEVKPAKPEYTGMLKLILDQLEDAKAEQIVTIGLDGKSAIADNMVVASGRSNRHVGAIADQLIDKLKEAGHRDIRIEGVPQCDWVLVDAGDVVVHVFRPEVRSFYNLEKLWSEHAPGERPAA